MIVALTVEGSVAPCPVQLGADREIQFSSMCSRAWRPPWKCKRPAITDSWACYAGNTGKNGTIRQARATELKQVYPHK
ncbi:hypothetical protein GCM10009091_48580 [Pseudomonas brenneri]|nr:hypothetical protein GCM10009091_48580 [Pseudomonas brenneri]